jgi:hypothetical protein
MSATVTSAARALAIGVVLAVTGSAAAWSQDAAPANHPEPDQYYYGGASNYYGAPAPYGYQQPYAYAPQPVRPYRHHR